MTNNKLNTDSLNVNGLSAGVNNLSGSLNIPNALSSTTKLATSTLGKGGFGSALSKIGGGLLSNYGNVLGVASGAMDFFGAKGNTSQKQMQRGDAAVNTVAAGLSFIPGFGTAAGAAVKLVNSLGGKFIKQPSFMKNYNSNENVMKNAASFGGVAAGATDAESTKGTYDKSGLTGKLIGRNKTTQNIFKRATDQQRRTQGVLDESSTALDNSASSSDMFNTRSTMNQMGTQNMFNRGAIKFGKKGMQFALPVKRKDDIFLKSKIITKLQKGGTVLRRGISANDRDYWNGFVDYVEQKGYKGDPNLDIRDTNLSRNLWQEYGKTKGFSKNYEEFIPIVQNEILHFRNEAIDKMKSGKALLQGYTKEQTMSKDFDWDNKYMPTISKVDGWAGSKTTSWKFPTRKVYVHKGPDRVEGKPASVKGGVQFNEYIPDAEDLPITTTTKVKTHAEGGSIQNIIVSGELHSRKHHIKNNDEFADARITTKGVPVIVHEDGGVIAQAAEVEREELIFHKRLTEKIEELYENGDEESMIEAGRLLSIELTKNIKDNTDVISKIEKDEENKSND